MLIVCTRDAAIVRAAQHWDSGANRWGTLGILDPAWNQQQANRALAHAVGMLAPGEPLCFSAHGNDHEIGDAGNAWYDWGWTRSDIADLLANHAPRGYAGPVLVHACAERISNFSAGLAVQLEYRRALRGAWIYGYNRALPSDAPYPRPDGMHRNVELQGTQVRDPNAGDDPEAAMSERAGVCVARLPAGLVLEFPEGFGLEEARQLLGLISDRQHT